jgi:hypothetical protein
VRDERRSAAAVVDGPIGGDREARNKLGDVNKGFFGTTWQINRPLMSI